MIEEIVAKNRLLKILQEQVLKSSFYDENLYAVLENYTSDYLKNKTATNKLPEGIYFKFMRAYNKDMKEFLKTGKYPLDVDKSREVLNRFDYDIVLLFSCLFTAHRFRIMQLIQQQSSLAELGLFIGCGPGLEIELVKGNFQKLYAYDLSIDKFLLKKHPKVNFNETYFEGKTDLNYDTIYLIELLEHLHEPYKLIQKCKKALSENGKILLTTATNIPQFDHIYNFETSHQKFENKIKSYGFSIVFKEDIPHEFITLNIGAKNRFYVLEKNSKF